MTPFERLARFVGLREIPGPQHHPLIQWWHSLCRLSDTADEVPWCSSCINGIMWDLNLPRSQSAAARSWLRVGTAININDAVPGYDVVIFKRGPAPQPGPDVIAAPGHVGLFAGLDGNFVWVLGGNQSDSICFAKYPLADVLGTRRIKP